MYLHHLTLQAIGPFADRVEIDVAALGASGVFLLEGPTGSGKSTIIDAVVFALYGSLAGDASGTSKDRLHSHHAAATTEPFVELVFETGAGVHRVRRTPAYDRPKQRGTGTVRQQASARLWRLATPDDTVGEPLSETTQEIGSEIQRIVGLDRAQFVQTVVLPQGEFARFLRAPGEVRRELLQSLFGTEIYVRTADELAAGRRAAVASVEQADRAVADALGRFEEASGSAELAETDVPDVVAALATVAADAERTRATAATDLERTRAAVADAVRRTTALERRRGFVARAGALAADADGVAGARERLALAERAGRVLALLTGLDAARRTATQHDEARTDAIERHGSAVRRLLQPVHADRLGVPGGAQDEPSRSRPDEPSRSRPDEPSRSRPDDAPALGIDALRGRAAHLRDAAAESRHLVDVERHLPERRALAARTASTLGTERDRLADHEAALGSRDADRLSLLAVVTDLTEHVEDSAGAERALADAQHLARTVVALAAANDRLVAADTARAARATAAQAAIDHESDLRRRRAAGLAGELGAALADGDACPVCGSHEHPAVAVPLDDHPDADAVQAAADARARTDADLSDAAAEFAVAVGERDRLRAEVQDATAESVLADIEALRTRIDRARATEQELVAARAAVDAFDVATDALRAERSATLAAVAATEATLGSARAAIDTDVVAVGERIAILRALRGADGRPAAEPDDEPDTMALAEPGAAPDGHDGLAAVVELVEADARVLADLADVLADAAVAEHDFEQRALEVAAALDEHGFVDADTARAARLTPADGSGLRERVAAHERESAIVESALQEPEVRAAVGDSDERIALAPAQAADELAQRTLDGAAVAAATSADRLGAATARASDLERAVAARESTSAASRAVVRLADIAAAVPSVNPSGITLPTYVLMRRFEDVVAAANSRLGAMLGGRFTLEASDERETSSRARRTGLALAVLDHETGRSRDPKSLSGGETFTTSLCLALGLADVVQAEAGGVELGTLFVDEGFGTLDPETLDGVIGQLAQLTAGGRQVGIVSHVEELKQRIPDRIEVRRSPGGGSRVTTTL